MDLMILRRALGILGVIELLAPRRLTDFWMGLAARNGDEVVLRPWVYATVRLEGAVILLWVLTRGRRSRAATGAVR